MTDSDYSAIRPVEGLQTIQGLTPIQRQEERKRRQDAKSESHSEPETETETEEAEEPKANPPNQDDPHSIDYCA
jgi:hypothetical protein